MPHPVDAKPLLSQISVNLTTKVFIRSVQYKFMPYNLGVTGDNELNTLRRAVAMVEEALSPSIG